MEKENLTFAVPSASKQVKEAFKSKRDALGIKLPQFLEFAAAKDSTYNNPQGFEQIRNVFYGRRADLTLTNLLTDYEREIQNNH